MAALNLSAVMTDLATAVQTVLASGRTAHGYPVESLQPGDAVVGYPEGDQPITGTFGRGMDRVKVPVWIICGFVQDSTTRTAVSGWVDASSSVVTAIEGYAGTWSSVRVESFAIDRFDPVGTSPLVVIKFTVDVLS